MATETELDLTQFVEAGGFVRSNPDVAYPNVMFQFLPIASRSYESSPTDRHGYQLHVGPVSSDARGYVRIRSANPTATPSIRFNFLSTEQDRREWIESVRIAREILSQPAFAQYDGGEAAPGPAVRTDDEGPFVRVQSPLFEDRGAAIVGDADRQGAALIGFAQAGGGGFFDDGGFPVGKGWEEVPFPQVNDPHAYALEISGDSMKPAYRDGDVIVVSPGAPIRRGAIRKRDLLRLGDCVQVICRVVAK